MHPAAEGGHDLIATRASSLDYDSACIVRDREEDGMCDMSAEFMTDNV